MSSFYKNGIINGAVSESLSENILNGTHYSVDNPITVSGTASDIIKVTDNYAQVTPGETYYLMATCNGEWSPQHGYSADSSAGKACIWLYISKVFNTSSMSYDSPILFTSKSMISTGVWKYTVPAGYNMARIRLNTYSNGTDTVSLDFWNLALIPASLYTKTLKINNTSVIATEIIEV